MRRLLIILVALILAGIPVTSFGATDQRVALVIGNGRYLDAPLRNPVNDATDMASALKRLGFSVILETDANQRAMKEAIRSFGKQLHKGGVGLFYYAGHGIQYRGRNYLIPIHAAVKSAADIEYEAVDAGRVLAQMEDAGNDLNIIILDACRNNPFARSFRSAENGLARMDAPTGSILAYATAPGSVAADGTGRNGLYTAKLLKYMQTPGITVERMFKLVRKEVTQGSGKEQVPWESSSLIGDFYFVPGRGMTVVAKPPVQKEVMVASKSPQTSEPQIVARDGSFEKLSSGIVFDRKTKLEWYVGPDKDTNWVEAERWAKSLTVPGDGWRFLGGRWRLPTYAELRSLYLKGAGAENMTPLLQTSGSRVWSSEKKTAGQRLWNGEIRDTSLARAFVFTGGYDYWETIIRPNDYRVFAVRKQK